MGGTDASQPDKPGHFSVLPFFRLLHFKEPGQELTGNRVYLGGRIHRLRYSQ